LQTLFIFRFWGEKHQTTKREKAPMKILKKYPTKTKVYDLCGLSICYRLFFLPALPLIMSCLRGWGFSLVVGFVFLLGSKIKELDCRICCHCTSRWCYWWVVVTGSG